MSLHLLYLIIWFTSKHRNSIKVFALFGIWVGPLTGIKGT